MAPAITQRFCTVSLEFDPPSLPHSNVVLQEVLGNSSSPGTSQSSQVMEHEEPHHMPGTSAAPQQINVKHNIKTPNAAGGDGTGCSIFLDPFPVFEKAVETPLPMLTDDDTWASWIRATRTHFVPTGYPDFMNSGARTNLLLRPHMDQQGCEITLTIDTRIIIKATHNPLPTTQQVCLLLLQPSTPPSWKSVC